MTSPPQWKVQLLERKRRDEEEGRRREKEEQERLARIPAWKREIIERRRARLWPGSSPSEIPAEGQAGPSPTGCTAKIGTDGTEPEACVTVATDSVVVWENIGPLRQNHFIQREKQRKSGLELEQAPLGVPGTELSSQAPGVTVILGDDMTIIESRPGLPGTKGKPPSVNGDACQPDLRSPLSRSAEDLNCFGRCQAEVGAEGPGRGRVTRLLSRFGQRGRPRVAEGGSGEGVEAPARPSRSRSTENILERRGRSGAASSSVPPGCAHAPGRGRRPQSRSPPSPPRTVSAFRSRFEARSATETPGRAYPISAEAQVTRLRSRGLVEEGGGGRGEGGQPGPVSGDSRRLDPNAGSGPAGDIKAEPGEAQALADGEAVPSEQPQQPQLEASAPLLLSSPTSPENVSALSSPRPQQPVSAASSSCAEQAPAAAAASCLPAITSAAATDRRYTGEAGPSGGQPVPGPEKPAVPDPGPEPDVTQGEPSIDMSGPQPPTAGPREVRLPAFTVLASRGRGGGGGARDTEGTTDGGLGLKGTWSPTPSRHAAGAVTEDGEGRLRPTFSPAPQRKSGRTITINPRKMATSKTPPSGNATMTENGTSGTPPAVSPATPAKKRYPTAEEIQVIGGYLTLQRSCLVKSGISRGKFSISFNDGELETTFEYPSELALLSELGPDSEETPAAVTSRNREPANTTAADDEDEEEVEEGVLARRLGVDKTSSVGAAVRRKPLLVDGNYRR
ncbi:phostensin-like [Hemiscyllium ocellatum]|uniref:phostensin-like n=1 Tax=Hemiscyllium ocellatum TaxID=170820 RepID=UPI0029674A8E|nr:phostensin-like [Hemiscyllium ocellatum]